MCDEYRKSKGDLNQREARAGHLGASDAHAQVSTSQAQFKPRWEEGQGVDVKGLQGQALRPAHATTNRRADTTGNHASAGQSSGWVL